MKKFFLYMFGVGAAIIAVCAALFLIIAYWDKILSGAAAGARAVSNVLSKLSGGEAGTDDPSDYYDL